MNRDELVKLMTGMMGLIWNCSIGLAMIRSQSSMLSNAVRRSKFGPSPLVVIPGGFHHPGRSHQVEHPGAEAEYQTNDQAPRGRSEQTVDDPTQDSAGRDPCNEFGREPEGLAESAGI
jgi:hypothetical protein